MSLLSQILADKRSEIDVRSRRVPIADLRARVADLEPPRNFLRRLKACSPPALIAEVKKASPSKGLIRPDFDPVEIARTYETAAATCLSVLTDETYFQGSLKHLTAVKEVCSLPVLRKDFIIDEYQLYESRVNGADAILLIVAALTADHLKRLLDTATELQLSSLVEVHDEDELETAVHLNAPLIGINNRNLHTFQTTLETTIKLMQRVTGDHYVVSESGIFTRSDVVRLVNAGVHAVLVGEALMRQKDIAAKVHELLAD